MRSNDTIVPCRRAACIASSASAAVSSESAPKTPPQWNQRAPSAPKIRSQSTSPGRSFDAAEWARSEQPSAGRTPKPRSVKLSPLRASRPTPSYGSQPRCACRLRPGRSDPRSAARRGCRQRGHDRRAQAEAALEPARDVVLAAALADVEAPGGRDARSPGSRRSMTSPSATRSQRHSSRSRRITGRAPPLRVRVVRSRRSAAPQAGGPRRASFRRRRARTGRRGRSGATTARRLRSAGPQVGIDGAIAATNGGPPSSEAGKSFTTGHPRLRARAISVAVAAPGTNGRPSPPQASITTSSVPGATAKAAPASALAAAARR